MVLLYLSDWLLLQTPQLVFEEGETITLRCHSWKNKQLTKVLLFQNGKPVRYYHQSSNFSIPKANHSHSGNYYCKANLERTVHESKPVTITVQGEPQCPLLCFKTLCSVLCPNTRILRCVAVY